MRPGSASGAVLALCLLALGAGSADALVRQDVTVRPQASGPRLAPSFLGISWEYGAIPYYTGAEHVPNEPLITLFGHLSAQRSGPPLVRVGGASTDDAWWNPTARPHPPGLRFNLNPGWVDSLRAFVRRTRSPLILGLNLAQDDPSLAVDWARAALAGFGPASIRAFEVGNEPDVYPYRGYKPGPDGRVEPARPRSYDFTAYLREFGRAARALRRLRPRPPLAGPVGCCYPAFDRGLPRLLRRHRRDVRLVTYHAYPLDDCGRTHPTIPAILSPDVSAGVPRRRLARLVSVARRAGRPLRVTETNSIACGGRDGVSNTFAAALWGADWLFELAAAGVQGADLTGYGTRYAPIVPGAEFDSQGKGTYLAAVQPLYYGMLLFARATAGRARLVRVDYDPRTFARHRANVKVWAARDGRGTLRIVVIHKDLRRQGVSARVHVPGARRPATVERLTAPGLDAKSGVRLGGRHVAEPVTYDGRLLGRRVTATLRPRASTYAVRLARPGAALLTIPHAGR
jgi:hypothetical protein